MYEIGKRIAESRKSKNMTQEELAKIIGVSAQTISKWENEITMPDILLLPVIADIFGITVDSLYGRENLSSDKLSFDDLPKEAYLGILENMQRSWNTAQGESIAVSDGAKDTADYLSRFPDSHSMIITGNNGFTYVSSDIALSYIANEENMYNLLKDNSARDFLKAISSDNLRTILIYCINNQNSFTAATLAQKCNIAESDAQQALDDLVRYNLIHCREIEIDDQALKVYSEWANHKVRLICSILRLAHILSNYNEHYRGFRN